MVNKEAEGSFFLCEGSSVEVEMDYVTRKKPKILHWVKQTFNEAITKKLREERRHRKTGKDKGQ